MNENKKRKIVEEAIERAGDVFGVDPAYFGEEGAEEVDRQIKKLGYDPEDFKTLDEITVSEQIHNLYPKQKELDTYIYNKHDLNPDELLNEKITSLIVELGELMNELPKLFKYWKVDPEHDRDFILEEYVDGLHFLLSIGNDLDQTFDEQPTKQQDILILFHSIVNMATQLRYNPNIYPKLFSTFMYFGTDKLGYRVDEILEAYDEKYETNVKRQQSDY